MSSADNNLRSRTRIWFARLGQVQKVLAALASFVITTGAVVTALIVIVGLPDILRPDGPEPGAGGTMERSHPLPEGVLVTEVIPNSPADRAGVGEGDIIRALAGEHVEDVDTFHNALKVFRPGDLVLLSISRDSRTESVDARLDRIPGTDSKLGVEVKDTRPQRESGLPPS